MAKPMVAKDTTEVAWLLFATLGVVVLTLVGHSIYRDMEKLVRSVRRIFTSRKRAGQKRKIMGLLNSYSDRDLASIAFSLSAWSKEGFPDKDLYIRRPPHYREDLKLGFGTQAEEENSDESSKDWLARYTRYELLAIISAKLSHRSSQTLIWLEEWLELGGPPVGEASDPDG